MWNATNLYFVLCCFVLCLVISFCFFASPFLPFLIYLFVCFLPFFVALSFLLHDLWCLKSHKHSFNLTCLHFWINTCFIDSWKLIHTFSWWFLLFFGVCFSWNELCLAVRGSPWCSPYHHHLLQLPSLHYTHPPPPASLNTSHPPGCSSTLAALLAPAFLSRPLPPPTGLAPP